jgi:type II secretory ATPase GspE/PulE/Tfp pilus assembly ATPase PilB-like protein
MSRPHPDVKGRLGDRLLERGIVTREELEVALSEQRHAHRPLGEILISLGFVKPEQIAELVAEDLGLEFLQASRCEPDPLLVAALDSEFVRETLAFPIGFAGETLRVVMVDPGDPEKVAAVRGRFPYPLEIAITTESELQALSRAHMRGRSGRVATIFADMARRHRPGEELPIERLTQALLLDGVHREATDIHIEPDERVTRVRYRLDGILCQGENLPVDATAAVISRIKILAGIDIAERRRPQDGRIRLSVDEREVDLRVSSMPCADGENVVIRILDRTAGDVRLPELGIALDQQRSLQKIAERSHGLFLVTGPTGSGKTTTLYSVLAEVDAMRRNVCTIEDPIEYKMPLLRQSQVDPSIGFGFKEGLRALLRQDPDVLLVGEIRDQETADMAIKASMTGHLVFSTLHTNSALAALPRLIDMGIDPYLIEDSLIGILAQRLVRKVCRTCARPAKLSADDRRWLGDAECRPLAGAGCDRCGDSGYSGRTLISELFLPDEEAAALIRRRGEMGALREAALASGLVTMTEDGKQKVRAGITTRAEVERVNKGHRFDEFEREDL